ncbi:MAG: hypothetical protein QFB87_00690 [Patescibacteria group bacterium]|nr:hypothetical protein [Patescibacteria group bacterium]
MNKIVNIIAAVLLIVTLTVPSLVSAMPLSTFGAAVCGAGEDTAKGQVLQGAGVTGSDCTGTGVNKSVRAVITILSIVVGVAAVIMIIIAGLKYVTSGGDSNGISSAKNTLIYALVGLFVAASAQLIVRYVLANAVK